MTLRDILGHKGTDVHVIGPNVVLKDVVQKLVQCNCGSLVVCEPVPGKPYGPLQGIITERDILRACASRGDALDALCVADVMTREVITGSPEETVESSLGQMTDNRIRHMPVVENGELAGLVSIGDAVKCQLHAMAVENHYLKNYIRS